MSSFSAIELIQRMVRGQVALNIPMSNITSSRTGGSADILITPADTADLAGVVKFLSQRGIKYFVMGAGSGILVRDGGIRGAVVRLGPNFQSLDFLTGEKGQPLVKAGAGTSITELVRTMAEKGLGGLEFLYGIPGTVGGAIFRNAASEGGSISDMVVSVDTMNMDGEIVTLPTDKLKFGTYSCALPPSHIILGVTLCAMRRNEQEIKEMVKRILDSRLASQPLSGRTTSMLFIDPADKPPASELISQCGLRGIRVGDAEISPQNPNFIINIGEATTANVIALIGLIQERVYVKHKIHLKPFIETIGSRQQDMLRIKK